MLRRFKIKPPRALRGRLEDVAKAHDLGSAQDAVEHFVDRGLTAYGAEGESLRERLEQVVDDKGYSSVDELVEHLLLRGLRAYEEPADDPAALEKRLRGLGYID
jgi:hypothetical protein